MPIESNEEVIKLPKAQLDEVVGEDDVVEVGVQVFRLKNANGYEAIVTNYGAMLISFKGPKKSNNNEAEELTLGFERVGDYLLNKPGSTYFGASVGRVANRIREGRFVLDGKEYTLPSINNGKNHLHGGFVGFNKRVWKVLETFETESKESHGGMERGIKFGRLSKDGEEGYPGNLKVEAIFRLFDHENLLVFEFNATTDAPTPVNLTNHAFWNLHGVSHGGRVAKILDHELHLNCDHFVPVDDTLIPLGNLQPVQNTPMDFFSSPSHTIGERIEDVKPKGYDHCFVLSSSSPSPSFSWPPSLASNSSELKLAATVIDRTASGRKMEVWTNQPGIQVYTGNFLTETQIVKGSTIDIHTAMCLETQKFPDAVNQPNFPSVILRPGETYHHLTVHRFSFV